MSTLTYLTSLVQQAISRLNNYEANAKKVDELPHQTTLEPTSKIPVSRAGNSEHVTVQQIISSIQNSNYNQLLAVGNITVDGSNIIVPSGVSGQINGSLYGTSTEITIPIALCDAGFNRKDILVLTTSNTIIAISGEETDGAIVLAPPTPTDTVYITEFDVNDTSIGAPIDPIIGTSFKKKSESLGYGDPSLTGSNAVIQLRPEGNSRYALGNAGLVSIDGFGLSLITGNPSAEVPYDGKDLFIENTGTTPFTLKHDGSGSANIKFFFIDETDLIVPAGGKVWLKYGNPYCEVIFTSWSLIVLDLQQVTNVSNETTNNIRLINPSNSFMELLPYGIYLENQLEGKNASIISDAMQFGDEHFATNIKFKSREQNTDFFFEDEGDSKSIATREWVNTKKYDVIKLQITSNPSPNDGDLWLEENSNTGLKIRINGVTKTITLT